MKLCKNLIRNLGLLGDFQIEKRENVILSHIRKSKSIKMLDMSSYYCCSIDIINLCRDGCITYLDLSNFKNTLTLRALTAISRNPILETLLLNHGVIGDKGMSILAKTKSIKFLEINNNNGVADESAFYLSKNKSIKSLKVSFCNITFAGARALIGNSNITRLDINYNEILHHEAQMLREIANERLVKIDVFIACDEPEAGPSHRAIV